MQPTDPLETLRQYQQWRRGGEGPMLDPVATGQAIDAVMAELLALREAVAAVVARWDTPLWKDVPATAEYIGRLRKALAQNAADKPTGAACRDRSA